MIKLESSIYIACPFVLPIYDVQVVYTVTAVDAGSLVRRQVCVTLAGMFRLVAPIMRGAGRAEGDRIVRVLKDTLERPNGRPPIG